MFWMQIVAVGNMELDIAEKPFEGGLLLFQKLDYVCVIVREVRRKEGFCITLFFGFTLI